MRLGEITLVVLLSSILSPSYSADPLLDPPAWQAMGEFPNGGLGASMAVAGDVNGDGQPDLIVGAPGGHPEEPTPGQVFVYYGTAAGFGPVPDWRAESGQFGSRFGASVAAAGDLNGDGFADIAVGAPRYSNGEFREGAVFVWFGGIGGLGPDGLPTNADWIAESDQEFAQLGISVAGAGDVNRDGRADILAGAWRYNSGEAAEGKAFIWYGQSDPLWNHGTALDANWSVGSNASGAQLGVSVASAGDVNGDGLPDVIVGADRFPNGSLFPLPSGRARIYLGMAAGGLMTTHAWEASGGEGFGTSVASAGDVNGDGRDDVLVGAPLAENGEPLEGIAYLFLGAAGGLSATAVWSAEGNQRSAGFGTSLGAAGDVNGDGFGDLVVGAPYASSGAGAGSTEGRAALYLGSMTGLQAIEAWSRFGTEPSSAYGSAVAGGDVDGDRYADVLIGAPGSSLGGPASGAATLRKSAGNTSGAPPLSSLSLSVAVIEGGEPAAGRIDLGGPSPTGGVAVHLLSSDPGAARVPRTLVIPPGEIQGLFTVETLSVSAPVDVTITASLGANGKQFAIKVIPEIPPVFDNPPTLLRMGGFELTVESYESKEWDSVNQRIIHAYGFAAVDLTCDGVVTKARVRFEDLTIAPLISDPRVGDVLAGKATYPTMPATPVELRLAVAGFSVVVESLTILSGGGTAKVRVEMPTSLADVAAGLCRPGALDVGDVAFTSQCEFYTSLSAAAYGAWAVGNTGMEITSLQGGSDIVVDFSTAIAPTAPPALGAGWRGVVLRSGRTLSAPSGMVVSNTGYLKAPYEFTNALIMGTGLFADLTLALPGGAGAPPYEFHALQPFGYSITIQGGSLTVVHSTVVTGNLAGGQILLPKWAVRDWRGDRVDFYYSTLAVLPDLDLYAELDLDFETFYWGDYVTPFKPLPAYSLGQVKTGHFFLSGTHRPAYFPLNSGSFWQPTLSGNMAAQLKAQDIQGLTVVPGVTNPTLSIYTPDVPDFKRDPPLGAPLKFGSVADFWLNVGSRGVHGRIVSTEVWPGFPPPYRDLGPTYNPSYAGGQAFQTAFGNFVTNPPVPLPQIFTFIDSASFEGGLRGAVRLKGAIGGPNGHDAPFKEMRFTSTAHNAGGKLDLSNPLPLKHWELFLAPRQKFSAAGILSVKIGKIYLTDSGIQELRTFQNPGSQPPHFALPFWLLWGEVLASGQFQKLTFDMNSTGQKFDGFRFVPLDLHLSPYADPPPEEPFLHAAGTVHFDFFGANYLSIKNHKSANSGAPFYGRSIELLNTVYELDAPSDFDIARDWSGDFGAAEFTIRYDDADQDGFVGDGTMQVIYFDGRLKSSIVLASERICMSMDERGSHHVAVGPVADFGSMKNITGCACIEDAQLKRIHLAAELESSGNTLLFRSAGYAASEIDVTPATTEVWIHGTMFLNVGDGAGDIQVTGQARFLENREALFVEGDVEGSIDAETLLGGAKLSAEGRVSWHMGKDFNNLQGRLAIKAALAVYAVGVEGGFFAGTNTPKAKAWVIDSAGPRYPKLTDLLPETLDGVFAFVKVTGAVDYFVLQGGFEFYTGFGGFVYPNEGFKAVGTIRAQIWGAFLGGLVSASVWLQTTLGAGVPPFFEAAAGIRACFLFVCAEIGIKVRLTEQGGFQIFG